MPKIAFVFPGQGAQYPGMGREIAEKYPEAAAIFSEADSLAGYNISNLCFEGPEELLNQTEYSQPALLTCSVAIYKAVEKLGWRPSILAGLSLGEYSALVAAGAISFREALPLVQIRARLMQEAVPHGQGAMAAILGLNQEIIEEACRSQAGIADIANYNCPGQVVISGEKETLTRVAATLRAEGGRVIPLAVSVPSHSRLMRSAAAQLNSYLAKVNWQEPAVEVVSNVNALSNPATCFTDLLSQQLYSPVLWEHSIRFMMAKIDYFVEIGPGSTLSGLIRKIDRSRLLGQIEDIKSLEKIIEKVRSL